MRMAEPSCRGKRGRQIPASALFEIILRGFEWSGAAARKNEQRIALRARR